MHAKVDAYLEQATHWQEESALLRAIALDCKLDEAFKWGHPCYMLDGANVVLIHGFKEYCALLFFKGALMKDPGGMLVAQTGNVQAGRQIRFTSVQQIADMKAALKSYIKQAIAVEKSGLKVQFKEASDFAVPEEFQRRLDGNSALREAFDALTPGRRKAYLLHFAGAAQAKTREARIEKCMPMIFDGLGLNDR